MLPSMFRMEVEFRKKQEIEKNKAVEEKEKALKHYNKLTKERDDLKNDLERKQRLALQAMAARGNMKDHLDEAKNNYDNAIK
jgi:hypothetical protein